MQNEILSYSKAFNSKSRIGGDQCLPFNSCFSVSNAKQKNFIESGIKKIKKKKKKKKKTCCSRERFNVKGNVLCFIINF